MPPELSMRHTKLKAEEAALLAGEINKPSWQSRNEGIHERVSFEDTIWGFDLAGGSFYKTPLRVTHVKEGSRAEKAGIRPGDKLKRINDIDTSTLTIQEAHEIILESGIHLKIAVTAPEDEEDAYFCYEDPLDKGYDSDEERRREEERAKKRQVHARVSSYWSLQWPWVSKRRIIYRESNCFLVPSKYETKHIEKFPPVPFLREADDHVRDTLTKTNLKSATNSENQPQEQTPEQTANGLANGVVNGVENSIKEASPTPKLTHKPAPKGEEPPLIGGMSDGYLRLMNGEDDIVTNKNEDIAKNWLNGIQEVDEANIPMTPEPQEQSIQEISEAESEIVAEVSVAEPSEAEVSIAEASEAEVSVAEASEAEVSVAEASEAEVSVAEASEAEVSVAEASEADVSETPVIVLPDEPNGDVEAKDDDVIEELLNGDEVSESHEEEILDSILSESQDEDTSTVDER